MSYTESDDAMEKLSNFMLLLKQHQIPCSGFYLSSGYTTDEKGRRCVFNWNKKRIPEPRSMFQLFIDNNIKVIANVKPWLLKEHPDFSKVLDFHGYFNASHDKNEPSYGKFWVGDAGSSGAGCYLDFTNTNTYQFWKSQMKSSLLSLGCTAIWNDNNEYEVDDGNALCSLGESVDKSGRALQTLLMARASLDALLEINGPNTKKEDVLVVSRSGSIGTHRYSSQTWSGDNSTSWETLKFNITMCLGMGLSGWSSSPDIGGFAGVKPGPELFWRWIQSGVFLPRFCIHSSMWKSDANNSNDDSATNEPWMYPQMTDAIRHSIQLRYRLIPLIHHLHRIAANSGAPVVRPLLYHYHEEPLARAENFQFLLGGDLLVAPIYAPECSKLSVYLPGTHGWYSIDEKKFYKDNGYVEVEIIPLEEVQTTTFGGLPTFLRAGGGIVLSGNLFEGEKHISSDERQVLAMIDPVENTCRVEWFDGDWFMLCSIVDSKIQVTAEFLGEGKQEENKKARLEMPFHEIKVSNFSVKAGQVVEIEEIVNVQML